MIDFNQVSLLRRLVDLSVLSNVEAGLVAWWWSMERRPDESFPMFLCRKELLPSQLLEPLDREPLPAYISNETLLAENWPQRLRARILHITNANSHTDLTATPIGSDPLKIARTTGSGSSFQTPPISGSKPAKSPQVGSQLGKCLLTEKLGQGGTGLVFRALHQSLNISVAIKVLRTQLLAADPTVYDRFKAEACLLAQLNHPNLVRIWDFEDDPEFPYLILEFVEGLSLAELIQQSGRVRHDKALHFLIQVAEGLQFAQRNGIIHRDIKPSNILITRDGTAKIADLGLAIVQTEGQRSSTSSRGDLLGTPAYMAPEQAQSPHDVDHRADIYALGATFYHAIVGSPPFTGQSRMQLMYRHISEIPIAPHEHVSELPAAFSAIIMRMLAKQPDGRYADYTALLDDLNQLRPENAAKPISGVINARLFHRNIPTAPPATPMPSSASGKDLRPEALDALRAGIEYARAGEREKARERLRTVTLLEPRSELAWLWLAGVCETPHQAITCLEKVLALNPANEKALKGLAHYREKIPAPEIATMESDTSTTSTPLKIETPAPAPAPAPVSPPPAPIPAPAPAPSKPFLLIVDQANETSTQLRTALIEAGYDVGSVQTLHDARESIAKRMPIVLIIEPDLSDGDGYEFCQALRQAELTQRIELIVYTRRSGFMEKMRARTVRTASFLQKPCEPGRIVSVVRQLCPPETTS